MTNLAPGANASVNQDPLTVTVSYTPIAGADLDVSAFLLGANGKVRGDADMCFYGQTSVGNGAVSLTVAEVGRAAFALFVFAAVVLFVTATHDHLNGGNCAGVIALE